MYLIAKLYEQLSLRIKEKSSSRIDCQFFDGTLPEVDKRAKGAFAVLMDFPQLTYLSHGAGYGGQQVQMDFAYTRQGDFGFYFAFGEAF